ncbi:MAG: hypothetical protein M1831_000009 [Alyxoria varia]|nr:MAG: hypothetical protein M1831_000009 [Alyxoria varia]
MATTSTQNQAPSSVLPRKLWQNPYPLETTVSRFMRAVNRRRGLKLQNYRQLYAWSVADESREAFWEDCWKWVGLVHEGSYDKVGGANVVEEFHREEKKALRARHERIADNIQQSRTRATSLLYTNLGTYDKVVEPHTRMDSVPRWFKGVRLNYAENILYNSDAPTHLSQRTTRGKEDAKTAVTEVREGCSEIRHITWAELRARVGLIASAMKAHGVAKGDRVAVVASNSADTLSVFLAATSLGGIFSSSSTDMGTKGVLDRLTQIKPKWLFMDDGALYNGKILDLREKMKEIVEGMAGVQEFRGVVSLPRWKEPLGVTSVPKAQLLENYLSAATTRTPTFERVEFSEPFLIVYSSGTTGQPKCIVHGTGNVLLSASKDNVIARDVKPDSAALQFTTLCNISGGTDIAGCFAGENPIEPVYSGGCQGPSLGVPVAVYDSTIEGGPGVKGKETPLGESGDLVATRAFPNMPVMFWPGDEAAKKKYWEAYFSRFDNVWTHGDYVQFHPVTGQVIFLGRADGVLNPSGVRFGSAELYSVIEQEFPKEIAESVVVGQRRPKDHDESVMLFLKMQPNVAFTPSIVERVKIAIGRQCSKRHVPKYVFETPEIPTTVNYKKVELPIKRIVSGQTVKPSGTLLNPGSLEYYYQFAEVENLLGDKEQRSRL